MRTYLDPRLSEAVIPPSVLAGGDDPAPRAAGPARTAARHAGRWPRFDTGANRMVFSASELDRPIPTRNDSTRAAAVDTCRRLLGTGRGRPDIIVAVQSLLGRNLRRPLSMADTARLLRVTERTLRRRLAAAGERFSTVRDRVRRRRATFLLRESRLKIAEIATEVGFSDGREFRRAYIRWTGHPPIAERRDRLSSDVLRGPCGGVEQVLQGSAAEEA